MQYRHDRHRRNGRHDVLAPARSGTSGRRAGRKDQGRASLHRSNRLVTCPGRLAARRRRNPTERSAADRESRKIYSVSSSAARRRLPRRDPSYHGAISIRSIRHHLQRNDLAMNYKGFSSAFGLEPDKTRIFSISCFHLRGGSTVIHRERHSGHPWRWIECSAGIGPHGAVAVGTVVRRASRSLSPSRWRWD
jgi:hypothetical protein